MYCKKCGANIPDDAQFCAFCGAVAGQESAEKTDAYENVYSGAPIEEDKPDIQNNKQFDDTAVAPQVANAQSQPYDNSQVQPSAGVGEKPKKSKTGLIIGIVAGVVVLALAIAAVFIIISKNKNKEVDVPLIYYSENKLFACDELKEKSEAFEVCSNYAGSYKLTSDNKFIVYTQNMTEHETYDEGTYYTYDLYYRELYNEKQPEVLLAKGITNLDTVLGSVDAVYYEKNDAVYKTDNQSNTDKVIDDAHIVEVNE